MKKLRLPRMTAELMDQVRDLQCLADQISWLGSQIVEISGRISKIESAETGPVVNFSDDIGIKHTVPIAPFFDESHAVPPALNASAGRSSNIIPFKKPNSRAEDFSMEQFLVSPLLAMPGMPTRAGIFDFRPFLQRDGLILLSWDKRFTEKGELLTAYWVTSAGIPRFYASKPHTQEDFFMARPHHKSYAAEDGIEFYGQEKPAYVVHVAPELMKSNPRHGELRLAHINILRSEGSEVDFDYEYLLTKQKNRELPVKKTKNENTNQAGA